MKKSRIREILIFLREYGVLLMTVAMIVLSIQIYHHETHVRTYIDPQIIKYDQKLDSIMQETKANRKLIDSLRIKTDTVWNTLERIHKVKH